MKARTRATAILLTALCTPGTVATLTDCQLQSVCQTSSYYYDDDPAATTAAFIHQPLPPGAGVVDATHWESGPIDSAWLDYPGQRSVYLFPNLVPSSNGAPPALQGSFPGPYTNVWVYVSPDQNANVPGNNWTLASGNIAEITVLPPRPKESATQWQVVVANASCAQYYMRVVVERADPATAEDAGAEADAETDGAIDATKDASTDGPLDAPADEPLD